MVQRRTSVSPAPPAGSGLRPGWTSFPDRERRFFAAASPGDLVSVGLSIILFPIPRPECIIPDFFPPVPELQPHCRLPSRDRRDRHERSMPLFTHRPRAAWRRPGEIHGEFPRQARIFEKAGHLVDSWRLNMVFYSQF